MCLLLMKMKENETNLMEIRVSQASNSLFTAPEHHENGALCHLLEAPPQSVQSRQVSFNPISLVLLKIEANQPNSMETCVLQATGSFLTGPEHNAHGARFQLHKPHPKVSEADK